MSKQRLDIFKVLDRITDCDLTYLDGLSGDDQKGFEPYVVFLWLKGAQQNEEYRHLLSNEVLNPYVFALGKHPKLLYKLMCVSNGLGDNCRYKFAKKAAGSKQAKSVKLVMESFGYTRAHAEEALEILTQEDLIEMAEDLGYDPKEIKDIQNEWK